MADADKFSESDVFRFEGDGLQFKAKLIGVEAVSDYRGDDVCRNAIANLKAQVLTRKEHKSRIWVNLRLEGVRLSNQVPIDPNIVAYNLPIARVSYVFKDGTDPRAFGMIYRNYCDDTGENSEKGQHRFFAIKTEKPAAALLLDLKELFQVKHEIAMRQVENQKKIVEEEEEIARRPRAPSKAATELLSMQSELATLDTTRSQLTTAVDASESVAAPQQPAASSSGLADLQDVFSASTNSQPQQVPIQQQAMYGGPHQQQAMYGAPQQQSMYGAPQQPAMYAAPQQQAMYGAPQQQAMYAAPQQQAMYGAPQQQQAVYGAPQQQAMYGAPQQQQAVYGAPQQQPMQFGQQPISTAPNYYGVQAQSTPPPLQVAGGPSDAPLLQPLQLNPPAAGKASGKAASPQPQLFSDLLSDFGAGQLSKKEPAKTGAAARPTLSQLKSEAGGQ